MIDNSVDPDQIAPKEQSDLSLHCLSISKWRRLTNREIVTSTDCVASLMRTLI